MGDRLGQDDGGRLEAPAACSNSRMRRASKARCRWLRLQYCRGVRVPSWLTGSPHHSHERYFVPAAFCSGSSSLIPRTVAVTVTATNPQVDMDEITRSSGTFTPPSRWELLHF